MRATDVVSAAAAGAHVDASSRPPRLRPAAALPRSVHVCLSACLPAGMWRGSTVAVKTMVLPARMSGAEKRERMAIMEAAISSTMAHPNIVQVRACLLSVSAPPDGGPVSCTLHSAHICLGASVVQPDSCSAAGDVAWSHASTGWRLQVQRKAWAAPHRQWQSCCMLEMSGGGCPQQPAMCCACLQTYTYTIKRATASNARVDSK